MRIATPRNCYTNCYTLGNERENWGRAHDPQQASPLTPTSPQHQWTNWATSPSVSIKRGSIMQESFARCPSCQKQVRVHRPSTNHVLHLLLTFLSAGLWLPIWLLSCVSVGGWKCSECGKTTSRVSRAIRGAVAVVGIVFIGLVSIGLIGLGVQKMTQQAATTNLDK